MALTSYDIEIPPKVQQGLVIYIPLVTIARFKTSALKD